jgi:hypothetical protein
MAQVKLISDSKAKTKTVHDLKGLVGKPKQPVSIEDMNVVIARQGAIECLHTSTPVTSKRESKSALSSGRIKT